METVATLPRMSRERLSSILLSSNPPNLAIIDVRDDDHVGGHIHGSTHVPSSTLDYRIPEIVRTMAEKEIVVFHCALSQQRGPSAALRYLRERENRRKATERKEEVAEPVKAEGIVKSQRDGSWDVKKGDLSADAKVKGQEVFVLDGGFVKWQER